MDEHIENAANSGVLYIGDVGETFRERYEWLKWYYRRQGYRFCDVRKHILYRYAHMLDLFTFKALFELFSYQMFTNYRAELCDVANDNDELRPCCPNYEIFMPSSEGPPCHVYPLVKYHPMRAFLKHKPPQFGYFDIIDLIKRLRKHKNHG